MTIENTSSKYDQESHKYDQESRKTELDQLVQNLSDLNQTELKLLQYSLTAIKQTREQGLHFFGNMVGIELPDWIVSEQGNSTLAAKLHLGPHITNYFGVAQGGALYTFADITIGSLILARVEPGTIVATVELKMNYMKPGTGNILHCKPTILHWGKRTIVAECKITNEQDELVAAAMGTFYHG